MRMLTRAILGTLMVIAVLLVVSRAFSQRSAEESATEVDRGRDLVEEAAKCGECHTPRNALGALERDEWREGAPIWIRPVRPNPNWAERVPPLAGLPSLSSAQAERVSEEGTGPEGEASRPPMHTYHMNREDAKAIIASLRSLPEKHP
jgi:mono/diheme cytochrome c family protein